MTQASSKGRSRRAPLLSLSVLALALLVALAGCDLFGGGSSSTGNTNSIALNKLTWCDKPLIDFQDNSTTNQATLTNWDAVKGQLGFTTYLPATLPKGSCLVLAGGSIHDPIFEGQFKITYDLPSGVPISFSEGPKRPNITGTLDCVPLPQDPKTTICVGAVADTFISVASRQPAKSLSQLFGNLKPNIDWVPANTNELLATSTPSS